MFNKTGPVMAHQEKELSWVKALILILLRRLWHPFCTIIETFCFRYHSLLHRARATPVELRYRLSNYSTVSPTTRVLTSNIFSSHLSPAFNCFILITKSGWYTSLRLSCWFVELLELSSRSWRQSDDCRLQRITPFSRSSSVIYICHK